MSLVGAGFEGMALLLVAKMLAAVVIVVGASVIAERSGPLIAAMVATLPVSAGPVYVFLALEHDAHFIGQAALGSMGSNLAAALYCLIYVRIAQNGSVWLSIGAALLGWALTVAAFRYLSLPLAQIIILSLAGFWIARHLTRPYLTGVRLPSVARSRYALLFRAIGVAVLVAIVTTISSNVGPAWSGMFATFPIVLTSLAAILHARLGGKASAAALANAIPGLLGLGLGLGLVHVTAPAWGSGPALLLCLAISMGWNLALIVRARRRSQISQPVPSA
jgi:hypothetical protein